jgi:hypothetical protein
MAAVNKIDSQAKYLRRHPEQGLLYRIVETYWPMFLREQEKVGRNIPIFIKDEFYKYLGCGIAEFGYQRRKNVIGQPSAANYLSFNHKIGFNSVKQSAQGIHWMESLFSAG